MQFGPGLKLKSKYLGPYRITKIKLNDMYDVEKIENCEGLMKTITCAEYLKRWAELGLSEQVSSEVDDESGERNCGGSTENNEIQERERENRFSLYETGEAREIKDID